jgi:pyrroline-5-carboxylate reductase
MKIGIIGAGHMGSALVKGLYNSDNLNMQDIYLKSGNSDKAKNLSSEVGATLVHHYDDLAHCDMILLVVNETAVREVLDNLSSVANENTMIVSIVPSLSIADMERAFSKQQPIVSLLPNVVVEINKGIIGYAHNQLPQNNTMIKEVFGCLGNLVEVKESELDIFSTMSGCGPAIVDVFVEALSDGAVLNGMDRNLSYEVILEMIIGAAQLAQETGQHPGALKDQVTSPGGSTIKATSALEKNNFRYALIDAINAVGRR